MLQMICYCVKYAQSLTHSYLQIMQTIVLRSGQDKEKYI